jgi:hypothetical protein
MTYHGDVEEAHESTPLRSSRESDRAEQKPGESRILQLIDFFSGGIYAPHSSTYDPIEIILNTEDEQEQDRLTERWRDNRLSELSFVGVVVCDSLSPGPHKILEAETR